MASQRPTLKPSARKKIEREIDLHLAAVDALLAVLDAADGDPDLEAEPDKEPPAHPEKCGGSYGAERSPF